MSPSANTPNTLWIHEAREGFSLAAALFSWASFLSTEVDQAVGLIYAPRACRFVRLQQDGTLLGSAANEPESEVISPDPVFEARVFGPKGELRWHKDAAGNHRTVIVAEDKLALRDDFNPASITYLETIDRPQILWGQFRPSPWVRLSTARVGFLDVPFAIEPKPVRVQLRIREYLAEVDVHGNVGVIEERLIRLERAVSGAAAQEVSTHD
jgi:CRISPR-associated protein (TIGR03984 family)